MQGLDSSLAAWCIEMVVLGDAGMDDDMPQEEAPQSGLVGSICRSDAQSEAQCGKPHHIKVSDDGERIGTSLKQESADKPRSPGKANTLAGFLRKCSTASPKSLQGTPSTGAYFKSERSMHSASNSS